MAAEVFRLPISLPHVAPATHLNAFGFGLGILSPRFIPSAVL